MLRSAKDALVARWRPVLANAPALVVLEHQGVHGAKTDELRETMRRLGVRYLVVRRRLAARMLADGPRAQLATTLERATALALLPADWHRALGALLAYLDDEFETRPGPVRERKYFPRGSHLKTGRREAQPWRTAGPHLAVRAAWIDGRVRTADETRAIARMKPREASLCELVALLEAAPRALLSVLDAPGGLLLATLDHMSATKGP